MSAWQHHGNKKSDSLNLPDNVCTTDILCEITHVKTIRTQNSHRYANGGCSDSIGNTIYLTKIDCLFTDLQCFPKGINFGDYTGQLGIGFCVLAVISKDHPVPYRKRGKFVI